MAFLLGHCLPLEPDGVFKTGAWAISAQPQVSTYSPPRWQKPLQTGHRKPFKKVFPGVCCLVFASCVPRWLVPCYYTLKFVLYAPCMQGLPGFLWTRNPRMLKKGLCNLFIIPFRGLEPGCAALWAGCSLWWISAWTHAGILMCIGPYTGWALYFCQTAPTPSRFF